MTDPHPGKCVGRAADESAGAGGSDVIPPRPGEENEPDDATLVGQVLGGDVEAFGRLVERYEEDLARYARHVLGGMDEAEDVMQDALVRAYRSLDRCEEPSRFKGWLFRIVSNQCRTHLARRRRRPTQPLEDVPDAAVADEGHPGLDAEAADRAERLAAALERLSPDHREALVLYYVQELSVPELAEVLDLSVSAVKMRLHRGRDALRAVLEQEEGDAA